MLFAGYLRMKSPYHDGSEYGSGRGNTGGFVIMGHLK